MHIITADSRRFVTTPNGTMATLASPTLGGAAFSLWTVDMVPGAEGPEHAFEDEVIWAVIEGETLLRCSGVEERLAAGDTAVLPGGVMRQFAAGPNGFRAVASTPAPGAVTRGDDGSVAVPPWVA